MELKNIEILLEKYLDGETSISEENELRKYFSLTDISPHLMEYKPMFAYFSSAREQKLENERPIKSKKSNAIWFSIAASVVIMLGVATYMHFDNKVADQELGTYGNPKVALKETQRALAMLSNHVNTGIESVIYIKEYKKSKNLIFKQ